MNNGSGARGVGKGGVAPPKQKSEGTYSPPPPPPHSPHVLLSRISLNEYINESLYTKQKKLIHIYSWSSNIVLS